MWEQPIIEHNKLTDWQWMVSHPQHLVLGKDVDIGAFCFLAAHQGITIQDNVQIGAGTSIFSVDTEDGTQGEITIKKGARIGSGCRIFPGVTIGEHAKIDANCVIKHGVTIGDYAKVGVLSYVKCDIPEKEFWYGMPAVFKGRRKKGMYHGV